MLVSMTGFGQAQQSSEGTTVTAEVRSVNNRYVKISSKLPETHLSLQDEVERTVRENVRRGSLTVTLRIQKERQAASCRINRPVLESYLEQLSNLVDSRAALIGSLIELPGVVEEIETSSTASEDWPVIQGTLLEAVDKLGQMRRQEGEAMQRELADCGKAMLQMTREIGELSRQVVEAYRGRLLERVRALLADSSVSVDESSLVREVSILAERSDIVEELTRLQSHLDQYQQILQGERSEGRKLDFLVQEMYRETNTIGSKANDAKISQLVVELKGKVEQAREIIQNVE